MLSIVAAGIGWGPTDAGVMVFVLLGLVLPRFMGVRGPFDVVLGIILMVAGWSAVLELYTSVAGLDVVMHFAATGAIAAEAYLLLERLVTFGDGRPSPGVTVGAVTILGLAASAVWEILEWWGHTFLDPSIFVDYEDTIGDMGAGGLGSLTVGVLLVVLRRRRPPSSEPVRPDQRRRRLESSQ